MKIISKKDDFEKFKKIVQHPKEELLAILTVNPFTVRLAYLVKRFNLNISPNQITAIRLFILFPAVIFLLFLSPILQNKIFYLIAFILVYFMAFTDDLDGNIARGLNKTSNFGAFLDSIADRTYTFIMLAFIFSLGMLVNHIFLIYGAVFIILMKAFHLMIISKIFYYDSKRLNVEAIFTPKKEMKNIGGFTRKSKIMVKINKILKIERWCESIGGFERIFITFMVPAILFYFGFEIIVLLGIYTLTFFNIFFYVSRIKNLILEYHNGK